MKVKMAEPSFLDKLKSGVGSLVDKAKGAVGYPAAASDSQTQAALALPAESPGTTMTGGKRHRKTRRHRGGKKHRKTGKRKH